MGCGADMTQGRPFERDAAADLAAEVFEGLTPEATEAFRALKRLGLRFRAFFARAFARVGAHPGQASCLLAIARSEGLSQRELARMLDITPAAVTGMLQKVERAGLVVRRTDEHDQRYVRIHLTEAGRALVSEVRGLLREQIGVLFAGMTPEELRDLARLLDRLNANMDASAPTTEDEV